MCVDLIQKGRLACSLLATAAALMGCISDDAAAAGKSASTPTPAASQRCAFGAFVQEDDPAGLNVRATPSPTGRILGRLPPSTTSPDNPDFAVRIELDVLEQQGGWFHVEHAHDNAQLAGKPARTLLAAGSAVASSP